MIGDGATLLARAGPLTCRLLDVLVLVCAQGKRRSLPNARIMIHQPLGGAQGQAADIEIQAKEILFVRSLLNTYIAEYTGQPIDKIQVQPHSRATGPTRAEGGAWRAPIGWAWV